MNILVTGGAGFIGSNLCEALLKRGDRVTCLDNFATGHIENILPLLEAFSSTFSLVVGDICNLDDCHRALEGCDKVLHQAALGSVPRSIKDPISTNRVNISGFLNMLVASHEKGIERFVYAASSSSYGDSESLPKVEEIIGHPLSPYAVSKYVNELYADVFGRVYGLECIGLRYFNVFGPRQDPESTYAAVIPLFIKELISHRAPTINGDGENSRDFTYIDNVVEMNILALETLDPQAIGQIYNTAFGQRTTLNQLFGYLKEYLGSRDPAILDIDAHYGPAREGDIAHSLASIDKAWRLLGYNPKYSFSQGLEQTVDWYWQNLKYQYGN